MKNNNCKIKFLSKLGSLLSLTGLVMVPLTMINIRNINSIEIYDETDPALFNEDSFSDYESEISLEYSTNVVGDTFSLEAVDLVDWGVTQGSINFQVIKDDPTAGDEDYGEVEINYGGSITVAEDLKIPNAITNGDNEYKITSINQSAFASVSSLKGSLYIPESISSIGNCTFYKCPLTSITIDPNNPTYKKATNVGPDATVIVSGGTELNSDCSNVAGSLACGNLIIPDSVNKISGDRNTPWLGFRGCYGITDVKIGINVREINPFAFNDCINLKTIIITDSVTFIGENAFSQCSSSTSVMIPNAVTTIENSAFAGCSDLTEITITTNITYIPNSLMANCSSLTSIALPNSITSIENSVFLVVLVCQV